MPSEQLPRSKVFEAAGSSAMQAFSLCCLFVVGKYFGIQFFSVTDGFGLLSAQTSKRGSYGPLRLHHNQLRTRPEESVPESALASVSVRLKRAAILIRLS